MRRHRSIFDMFPGTVDLNQGPSFNGLDTTDSDEYNGMLSPTERRLLVNDISGEINKNSGSSRLPIDVDLNLEYNDNGSNDGGPRNADMEASSFGQSTPIVGYVDHRSTSSSQRSTPQLPFMNAPCLPRNLLPFPLFGNVNSRTGSSSSSGSSQSRSNINGGNSQPSSRIPNLNFTSNDQQRVNDSPPWTLFPYLETESRGHRAHFRSGPSSSSGENVLPPRHHQPISRLEVSDDMLVSEMILNALSRGENFSPEGYMWDPYESGVQDRHQDMRLDVDNMSYEELLALEEHIGDVNTGLTEEVISNSLKQRKYFSFMAVVGQHFEPCCICQEEYVNGDNMGVLDCGHEFHTGCIKQWLTQKNLCPICKMTGLST